MSGSGSSEIYFNPWDEAFRANPFPHYKSLYGRPPYFLNLFMPMMLVANYADVAAALRDHEHFSSVQPRIPGLEQQDLFGDAATVLFSDPPTHSRLRKLVSRAFTPKRIKDLEPRIREITAQLLHRAAKTGTLEVVGELATPLPVMVIAEMLGIPAAEYERFKYWSDRIVESDNTPPGTPLPEEVRQSFVDLREYLAGEIARRRSDPTDDLIGALITAHDSSEALSAEELQAFVMLLLLAGNETTTNLIGNGMLALMQHPQQLELLRDQPSFLPRAIEEMLRYDGPVQSTVRYNSKVVSLGGASIQPGSIVFVMLAAANRDPAHFADPDSFDIEREPNDHVAFGDGIHYCLGAALARLEAQIAFENILALFKNLKPMPADAELKYKGSYFLRGLAELRLTTA